MVKALSNGMSAYKSLPSEITKKINVNKAYKAARGSLNKTQAVIGLLGFSGTVYLTQYKWIIAGVCLLACGLNALALRSPGNKAKRQTAETLHAAYDEIVARAKSIKKNN